MSLSQFRKLFPITDDTAYLNHAAISPLSTRVTDAIGELLTMRSTGQIDLIEYLLSVKERLKKNLAAFIGATPEQIALISNTSEGFNWLVNGMEWQTGDRILLLNDEFPSNIYPFLNLEHRGIGIDFVPAQDGVTALSEIEKRLTAKTRILSVSFVKFYNGLRNDIDNISELCQAHDVLLSVDGIQGVGVLPLDVIESRIDFLSNGGHKWLMSPMGCGFMYIAPHVHQFLKPAFAGWLSVKDSWNFFDYHLDFLDDASRYEPGTLPAIPIAGAAAATDLLLEAGLDKITQHVLALGDYAVEKLTQAGLHFQGSQKRSLRSGIYTFGIQKAPEMFEYLQKNHIVLSLREGALRVSPHFYNTEEDIDRLADRCTKFLKQTGRGYEK